MRFVRKATVVGLTAWFLSAAQFFPAKADAAPSGTWTAQDFVIEGDTVFGFSTQGVNKLETDNHVILPSVSADGTPVTKVGSFAFLHNKKTAIAEYISREGENGLINDLDADGNKIRNIGEEFNAGLIHSVSIPAGYTYIGSDAFSENRNLNTVQFPDSLETIGEYSFAHSALHEIQFPDSLKTIHDQAFFDNQITGTLVLPGNLTHLGERAFKSNQISDIKFLGEQLTSIPEECFQDNFLSNLTIPLSISHIGEGAFSGNPGDQNYGSFVILWTADKTNPHQLPEQGFYINPSDEKKTTALDIDYTHWEHADFLFNENILTGFSERGQLKVKKNKKVELPALNNGIPITEIAPDAFRNVDFQNSSLKKYDIEEIVIPDSVEKIGSFAFQSNNLKDFTAGEHLTEIGQGAFMNNKIETLSLNSNLKIIDDAAFHLNQIHAIVIPENVEKIGNSAFRLNAASHLVILSDKIKEIQEMAFLSNALEEADLSLCSGLTEIGIQAFADNRIHTLTVPEGLTTIREEAFHMNQLREAQLPETVSYIGFNAFDSNPGSQNAHGKVLISISGGNKHNVADGTNFSVNAEQLADNRDDLKLLVEKLQSLSYSELRDTTIKQFQDITAQGRELLKKDTLSKGEKLKYIHDTEFFLNRMELDRAIQKAALALDHSPDQENAKLLRRKYDAAIHSYNNAALTDHSIKRLEKELKFLTDLVEQKGDISHAVMVQGHCELETPLPIPSYHIGVNVYFHTSGKILYVLDMSETIGEGQKDAYGNDILNVDEDNAGYHMLALDTLDDYEGLDIATILENNVDSIGKIRPIDKAPYHRAGFYEAVKDAAKDAQELLSQGSESASSKETEDHTALSGKSSSKHVSPSSKGSVQKLSEKQAAIPETGDDSLSGALYLILLLSGSILLIRLFFLLFRRSADSY